MKGSDIAKNIVLPFVLGGAIIAGVKIAATYVHDPALASIIAGLPTGLIAVYFVAQSDATSYASNYVYVAVSLVMSIVVFWILMSKTPLKNYKNIALTLALLFWALLAFGRYFVMKLINKKKEVSPGTQVRFQFTS